MSTSPPLVVADRYRLVAPLGQGGMGRVWRATDVVLHRDVAIKELVPPPGLTPDERREMRERSLREARAIARLNNINVVRVFDVLRTDADPWIVMEYVPSRSLQDTLASDGPVTAVRAAEVGLGVLNALRAAHRNGVVHRDVKPGNVLLGADGRVVLTDFGLATVPGDPNVTRTGLVLGSPAYIAPERARDGTAGPGADLWSLGATLYAAVEGASPFARPTAIATLAALATENPPPARNAGPLKPVLNGLLRKDPTHRINAEEAERLLLRATGRRSKLTFPMSPTMRRPGVGRERPALPGTSTPPVVPGPASGRSGSAPAASGSAPAASGSAPVVPGSTPMVPGSAPVVPGSTPVVPGPRPPVSTGRPSGSTGRPPGTPVFTPGKATVGRPARPAADTPPRTDGPKVEPPRLDATRVDTPPVRDPGLDADQGKTIPGTSGASPRTTGQRGEQATSAPASASANGALARGTRGVYGTIPAGEVAADLARRSPEASVTTPDLVQPTESPAPEKSRDTEPQTEPQVVEPAAAAPEAVEPTVAKPEAAKPEAAEPEAAKVEAAESEAAKVEAAESEAAKVEAAEPEAAKSETAKAGVVEPEVAVKSEAAGGPLTDAEPAPVAQVSQRVSKPGVGARAGASGSKAARKKGRGRAAKTAAAATKATATTSEESAPPSKADGAAKPEPTTTAEPAAAENPVQIETPARAGAKNETEPTNSEANAAVVSLLTPDKATTPPKKVAAAARSAERKVTTAAVSEPTSTGPTSTDSAAGTAVLNVPAAQTGPTSAFTAPSRPPWQPMAVPRREEPKRGVTVLGTTLTRRQTAIGGAVLLAVLLLLALLLPRAFGSDDDNPGTNRGTGAGTTPAASAAPSSAAAPPPAATGSAPASASPSPSAPATTSPAAAALPDGWYLYTDRTGFSVPLPDGVKPSGSSNELRFRWNNRLLIIAQTDQPQPDPYADWQQQERDRAGDQYRNYRKIKLVRVDYFQSAADWEFTYTTGSGNAQHAVKRNFLTSDTQAYSINWYTSPDDWDAAKKDLALIYQGFKPRR